MIVLGILTSSLGVLWVIGAGVTVAAVGAAFFVPGSLRKYANGLRKKRVEQIEGRIRKRVEVRESAPAKKNRRQTFWLPFSRTIRRASLPIPTSMILVA